MTDTVALVTGASKGVGRGAARALGGSGMTVYLTARSEDGAQGRRGRGQCRRRQGHRGGLRSTAMTPRSRR